MRAALIFTVAVAALASACATDNSPVGHIRIPGSRGTEFAVSHNRLSNERISLSRVDQTSTFRGLIDQQYEVELRVEGDGVKGERGSTPVDIKLEKQPNGFVARGSYGSQMVTVHLIKEQAGACAFRFTEASNASTCASEPQAVPLPPEFMSLSDAEQAAFLAVVFYR